MKAFFRLVLLVCLAGLSLQLYFLGRIAMMAVVDPESTAFERSSVYTVATSTGSLKGRQQWVCNFTFHLTSNIISNDNCI